MCAHVHVCMCAPLCVSTYGGQGQAQVVSLRQSPCLPETCHVDQVDSLWSPRAQLSPPVSTRVTSMCHHTQHLFCFCFETRSLRSSSWNLVSRPAWPRTHRYLHAFASPSTGNKGVCHYTQLTFTTWSLAPKLRCSCLLVKTPLSTPPQQQNLKCDHV